MPKEQEDAEVISKVVNQARRKFIINKVLEKGKVTTNRGNAYSLNKNQKLIRNGAEVDSNNPEYLD